jgi:hypothetical protein
MDNQNQRNQYNLIGNIGGMVPMENHQKEDDFHKVWNAERVAEATETMNTYGECPGGHPFYDNDPEWRAADIVYEYSEKELVEIAKCAKDVVYFANNYCKAMTDEGIRRITLRPYQERVLRSFQKNRYNVFLASRQIGKCFSDQTIIKIKRSNIIYELPIWVLYKYAIKKQRSLTFIERLKFFLYKLKSKLIYSKKYVYDL